MRRMCLCLHAAVVLSVVLATAAGTLAGPLFEQTSDLSTGRAADFDWDFDPRFSGFETADDFSLSGSATVTSVTWIGLYGFASSTPTLVDDFTIRFYADDGGMPALNPFAEYHVGDAVNRVDTGRDYSFGSDEFMYSAIIPNTNLVGGTPYYLSILANTVGFTTDWAWAFSGVADNEEWIREPTPPEAWSFANRASHAFTLNGTVVPEPSSLALLGFGCCTLLGCRLRRRRRKNDPWSGLNDVTFPSSCEEI